jgi:hypothetical protein
MMCSFENHVTGIALQMLALLQTEAPHDQCDCADASLYIAEDLQALILLGLVIVGVAFSFRVAATIYLSDTGS